VKKVIPELKKSSMGANNNLAGIKKQCIFGTLFPKSLTEIYFIRRNNRKK
jgi:hypothetical protein